MKPSDFTEALAAIERADAAAANAMARDLPARTVVQWLHGKDYRVATVIDHARRGLRLYVQGISSNFWIGASKITHRRLPGKLWERMDGADADPPPSATRGAS